MENSTGIEVRLVSKEDQHIIALSERQQTEILLTNPGLAPFATDIPIYIVLIRDGGAIACGGLRPFVGEQNDTAVEMKRVYVVPEARGRASGVADFLVQQLELHALSQGWTTMRLQTSKDLVVANRFYERHGYRLIPNYGDYIECPTTISYEKFFT